MRRLRIRTPLMVAVFILPWLWLWLWLFSATVQAAEDPLLTPMDVQNCSSQIFDAHYKMFSILRGMADFKAAVDAGYAGCKILYPAQFEQTQDFAQYWHDHAQRELDHAYDVVAHALDQVNEDDKNAVPPLCRDDSDAVDEVKALIKNGAAQQYDRAYQRRYDIITESQSAPEDDQKDVLEYHKNDSCRWVRLAIEKYHDDQGRRAGFRHILFEMTKDGHFLTGTRKENKAAFKKFEHIRDEIAAGKETASP